MVVVFCIALALRWLHLWETVGTPFFDSLSSDAHVYDQIAGEIAAGDVLLEERGLYYLGPLYPYFLALVQFLAGPSSLVARGLQVLLSAASAVLVYRLGETLFGRSVGLLAGLGTAVYGPLIFYSGIPLPATLVVFLNLVVLTLLIEALRSPAPWRWLATGLALGLAADARGNALLFAPFLAGAIIAAFGLAQWRRWVAATAWVALGTSLAIAPVTFRNAVVGGEFVPLTTNFGTNLYLGNHARSDGLLTAALYKGRHMGVTVGAQYQSFRQIARLELGRRDVSDAEVSRFWAGLAYDEVRRNPIRWLRLMGRKVYYYAAAFEVPNNRSYEFSKRFSSLLRWPLLGWGLVFPFALLGVVVSRQNWRRHAALLGFLVANFLGVVAFFVTTRYRLVAAPVLILYAAVGMRQLAIWVQAREGKKVLASTAALAGLGFWFHAFEPGLTFATRFESLGLAYENQGKLEQALASYDAALAISSNRPYANYEKGRLLQELGRAEEARKFLLRALRLAKATGDSALQRRVRQRLD